MHRERLQLIEFVIWRINVEGFNITYTLAFSRL